MRAQVVLLLACLGLIAGAPSLAAQNAGQAAAASSAYDAAIEQAKTTMMADPAAALVQSDRALRLAEEQKSKQQAANRANAMWLKAEALIGLNRLDEAGAIATEALAIIEGADPGSKLNGDLLRSRGSVQALLGNVQQALADYQSAHRIFRKAGIPRSRAIVLNDLGQIYWEAGDYRRSLRYYRQATEIYNDDPAFALGNHNNLGETYKALGQHADAEREYAKAMAAARTLGSPLLETRILSNLALSQIEQGKLAAAQITVNRALALSRNGEAADWRRFVYGVEARLAYERGDRQAAARLIDQSFAGADFDTTELSWREFHQLGAKVFDEIGQPEKALAHLRAFQRLDSQARDLVATASSQLMAAEFDFANQNLRIAELKQGQLERDIKLERQRSEFRTMAFVGFAMALSIVLGLTLLAFFRIRRSRNEVRKANAELAVVNADLAHALRAKTDFLAMTSHEIRTPLNGILGTAQVLLTRRDIDEESLKRVNLIKSAGETMKALVDDLLDVAKMESGQVTIETAPTAVGAILVDAGQLWRDRIAAKGLDYHEEIGALPDRIETDSGRLRQIVFNLLSNAVKFTHRGAITLRATCDSAAGEIAIAITDTGIGIPAAEQKRIFEAFHQVDNATTREFGGTGLGLSISQNLAHALGGRIELQSIEGEGSTFRLILPFTELAADARAVHEPPTSLAQCRLALVEESQMKQAILAGLIEPHVKAVTAMGQADACLTAIETRAIDHILLDAGSVAKSAEELPQLRDLIGAAEAAEIPVSVLFSPAGNLPLEEVSRLGYAQLLIKPIAGDALIAALRQIYEPPSAGDEPDNSSGFASAA